MDEPGGSVDVVRDVDVAPMVHAGAEYVPTGPAHIEVSLMNTGDGILATGSVDITLGTECSKCLVAFDLPVMAGIESLYLTEEEAETLGGEEDWEPVDGESVDLAPAIRSAVLLALPYAPLHDENCAGICPGCGCDLNKESCRCAGEESTPHPFDALKDLMLDDG